MNTKTRTARGFTLLELLIVIAILAILSAALVIILNPAESLKKSRDTQRMSDLATLKTALGLYITTVSSPSLGSAGFCLGTGNLTAKIGYSAAPGTCTVAPATGTDAATGSTFAAAFCTNGTTPTTVDGNGWIPVNFTQISGGSPVSNLPVDPTNTVTANAPTNANYVYRYACQATADSNHPSNVFELAAVLESDTYKGRMTTDGGVNDNYYEVGTSVKLMGTGTNF